jgi:disulfide bond formation protein DsbB
MLGDLLTSSSLQSLGLRISLPGWTILLFAALALTAWLVRRRERRVDVA